jgi:hypothetical protein
MLKTDPLGPTPSPVNLNHWESEFLTKYYIEEVREILQWFSNSFRKLKFEGSFFSYLKQIHSSVESCIVVLTTLPQIK